MVQLLSARPLPASTGAVWLKSLVLLALHAAPTHLCIAACAQAGTLCVPVYLPDR
jgi:hypothetical protein